MRPSVLLTYLRLDEAADLELPDAYRRARNETAAAVVKVIEQAGGVLALEADPTDAGAAEMLFDTAERAMGPVDILVSNASGWIADTFTLAGDDRLGRTIRPVSPRDVRPCLRGRCTDGGAPDRRVRAPPRRPRHDVAPDRRADLERPGSSGSWFPMTLASSRPT